MTALPPSSDFVTTGETKGTFKGALSNLRAFLAGLLGTSGNTSDALTALGALGNTVTALTGVYTVVAADRGKLFDCTGTWTLSLTASATLGNGFSVIVRNSGTGIITIAPNLTELVNGQSTLALASGDSVILTCTGTEWKTLSGQGTTSVNVQTFISNGTWAKPSKGNMALIECWGAGGGGGRNSAFSATPSGGGGGEYSRLLVPLSTLSASVSVTIGAGGAGISANGDGNDGGSTTFGSYLNALGGQGGNGVGAKTGAGGGYPSSEGYPGAAQGSNARFSGGGGGGGTSIFGGNGGANGASGGSGVQPGGGGGSAKSGTSGTGGNGKCVVTVY